MIRNRSHVRPLVLAILVMGAAACSRQIGDDCETNVQCSSNGTRQCDLSQPGGYCTVEGCDLTSCPDDALCVRFFPRLALRQDRRCTAGEIPTTCNDREFCIAEGYCVEPRFERRFCMKSCGSFLDCRPGYLCQESGLVGSGAELLPGTDGSAPRVGRFCVANASSVDAGVPGPDAGPVQDGPVQDGPAQDGPVPDGPAQDGPVQDGPAQDGPAQDGPLDGPLLDGLLLD